MSPEERKLYNQNYHNENKTKQTIISTRRVICDKCNREIAYSRLKAHQKTKICEKHMSIKFA